MLMPSAEAKDEEMSVDDFLAELRACVDGVDKVSLSDVLNYVAALSTDPAYARSSQLSRLHGVERHSKM